MSYAAHIIATIIAPGASLCHPDQQIEHLLTDSRKLVYPATTLFFALSGRDKKGDDFLQQLYDAGVRNFVVSTSETPHLSSSNIFIVSNVLTALQGLAAYHRSRFSIPVIGITGSNGKTVVKEWLSLLLADDYSIVRSPRSYNSQIGVPLSVWQITEHHTMAIIEAGISQAGEMEQLQEIIQPTIGVLTNIGAAHADGFDSEEAKRIEKLKLFAGSEVLIGERKYTGETAKPQQFTWGIDAKCNVQLLQVTTGDRYTSSTIRYKEETASFHIPFSDEASVQNCHTCITVLLYLGYGAPGINKGLSKLSAVDMRLHLKAGLNHCTIINDSYSADLTSLTIALHFLAQQRASKQCVAILSDFPESGKRVEDLYRLIADALVKNGVTMVVAIGEQITHHLPVHLPATVAVRVYTTTEDFLTGFQSSFFNNVAILIKGARRFGFERIAQLLEVKVHQTVLEIDLTAVAHNVKEYRRILPSGTRIMAMVKAFSYGGGGPEIAGILQFNGVEYLGVAYADEGIDLRKSGIFLPVMVLNTDEASFPSLVAYDLQPVIYSISILQRFVTYLLAEGISDYPVHIEIETGMNRLGIALDEVDEMSDYILAHPVVNVQSAFTHLAASEAAYGDVQTEQQAAAFFSAVDLVERKLQYPVLKHISNSAAALRHPSLTLQMVRIGIGLYGVESAAGTVHLRPVATLRATIAQIKKVKKGDTVGYGVTAKVQRDSVIATVRIGYADGFMRSLGNGAGKMWVAGHLAPVIGSVCMDMTMLDITGLAGIEGDDVIVFGKELPVAQVASWAGTIPYEIMTSVSQRVKRVYFHD